MLFLVLTSVSFCLFGFVLGVLADGFEKLQIVPMLILTPLTFLGGTFYSIDMLQQPWKTIALSAQCSMAAPWRRGAPVLDVSGLAHTA